MAELHDRMPVILAKSDWPKWLEEEPASEDELLALLRPCPDDALKIWPVGKAVGNVKNTGPQLAMPNAGRHLLAPCIFCASRLSFILSRRFWPVAAYRS